MEHFLTYLWKSAAIIIIFYGFYRLFLIKETYFQSIRYFLLSGFVLATLLPILIIPIYVDVEPILLTKTVNNKIIPFTSSISDSTFNWMSIIYYSYLLITAFFLIRFIFQLASISYLIHTNNKLKVGKYYFVETRTNTSPFSFFNFIIFNPDQFTQSELDQILAHEKVHVNQKHSIDTLFSNLLVSLQWFNPFAWRYKNDMEQNLEFIADEFAHNSSYSKQLYQKLLLKTSIPQFQMALANNFYNSLLKKRIIMLNKKRSNRNSQLKIALIAPLIVAFVFLFNTEVISQQRKIKKEVVTVNVDVLELLITKQSSKDDLKEITNTFAEKGLTIKFNGLKRNNKNEITAIKIDAKTDDGKASASYAANDDEGINPIHISFDNENNNLSIGSNEKGHGDAYFFSNKIHNKMVKHKVKNADYTYSIHDNNDDEETTNVWISKDGDTTKVITKKLVIDIDKDHDSDEEHEIHIEMDDDGKEIKKEIIKIKKGDGKGNYVFISDDNDDKNTITTYIVNGKKMSKEEFKKMDKDKIKTIEIKKEVKKKK